MKTSSLVKSSENVWFEKYIPLKWREELVQAKAVLEWLKKSNFEQILLSRNASNKSVGGHDIIYRTSNIKSKHKRRPELQKYVLLKIVNCSYSDLWQLLRLHHESFAHVPHWVRQLNLPSNSMHRWLCAQWGFYWWMLVYNGVLWKRWRSLTAKSLGCRVCYIALKGWVYKRGFISFNKQCFAKFIWCRLSRWPRRRDTSKLFFHSHLAERDELYKFKVSRPSCSIKCRRVCQLFLQVLRSVLSH